jgi:1-acyl-sn-glycerol-3-phosphate acyltransferase
MCIVSFFKTLISLTGWFIVSITFTLLAIPMTFLPAPARYTNRYYFFLTTIWTKLLMFFSFISIQVKGKENLPIYPASPAIIVANHTSSLDIFLVERTIGTYPHIWLTKKEYTKIPLFSILLKRMHVPVDREDSSGAARAFLRAYNQAKNIASHIILFPEGKRYDDGKIHDFYPGFAILAKKLNRPVIPIKMTGLHKIFPKKNFIINYHAATPTLTIGKPLWTDKTESIEDFSERVKKEFL